MVAQHTLDCQPITEQNLPDEVSAMLGFETTLWLCTDRLSRPQHKAEGNELRRYDRVLANPPFSQIYIKKDIEYSGRFAVWMPEKGKKADLMFVPHMP